MGDIPTTVTLTRQVFTVSVHTGIFPSGRFSIRVQRVRISRFRTFMMGPDSPCSGPDPVGPPRWFRVSISHRSRDIAGPKRSDTVPNGVQDCRNSPSVIGQEAPYALTRKQSVVSGYFPLRSFLGPCLAGPRIRISDLFHWVRIAPTPVQTYVQVPTP